MIETEIKNNRRDIDRHAIDLLEMTNEMQKLKQTMSRDASDTAAQLEIEIMKSKLESQDVYSKLAQLMKGFNETDSIIKEKFEKFMKESPSN